jgi:UDP-N-acetylglucosamine 3-dehydrogenase
MTKLRCVLFGYGVMGKNHARILKSINKVDLVGIYDSDSHLLSTVFEAPVLNSIEDVISIAPDYCVVATPSDTHEAITRILFENNINVLIEKPLSPTYRACQNIIEYQKLNGRLAGVGHVERFNAALGEAKRRLQNGELGQVFHISTTRVGPFPARITDVGVTIDLATHDIDLTKWLLETEYDSLTAYSAALSGRKNEDLISVNGQLKNAILVSHNVSWLSPLKKREIVITGERGAFKVDTLLSDLTFYQNGEIEITQKELSHFRGVTQGPIVTYEFQKPEALLTEHLEFIKHLMGEPSATVTLSDAAGTIKVAEAIVSSSTSSHSLESFI